MSTITKRIDINVGTPCNANCMFCYYGESVNEKKPGFSSEEVKRLLRFARKRGMQVAEFTGGEPTIRKDLTDMVRYAKELGFESVSIITNGMAMSGGGLARKLVEAGADDFLFSIHGPNSDIHDALVRTRGAFNKVVESVKIVRDLGARVRSNTVVVLQNYETLLSVADLQEHLQVRAANFLVFNRTAEAETCKEQIDVRYTQVAPKLRELIDYCGTKIPKITIREIPFCMMAGYERYVTNLLQLQYDSDEWNYLVRYGSTYGTKFTIKAMTNGIFHLPGPRRFPRVSWHTTKHEGIMKYRADTSKIKGPQCCHCRYDLICDGIWNGYAQFYGFDELRAVPGEKIADPAYFMKVSRLIA
ncbi:MAG: radical SAM protein [Nitrospiraceae bacterium]|nr:MAG: radical SAM protein [Nitrospiraceae bacterium]